MNFRYKSKTTAQRKQCILNGIGLDAVQIVKGKHYDKEYL